MVGHWHHPDLQYFFAFGVGYAKLVYFTQVFFPGGTCRKQYQHHTNTPIPFLAKELIEPLNCPLACSDQETANEVRIREKLF
jgi:hypothetical protein